jgi:ketosteroid isomerase-like protein
MNHAFTTYCASDGVLLLPDRMPVEGNEALGGLFAQDDSGVVLTWEPLFARAASSGELGYTYGTFQRMIKDSDIIMRGTYVTIWIKEDNQWRFALDSGNEGLGETSVD